MQLVFGRETILNIKHVAVWEHIRQRKQEWINCNNKRENMRSNNHQYKLGDKIIFKLEIKSKHELEFMCPFLITQKITMKRFDFKKESSMMQPILSE